MIPLKEDIESAHNRIKSEINKTPVFTSNLLNEIAGANLYFKCENFQKVGAFKFRGATNSVLKLSQHEMAKGVATHSSGNHAAALSLAAKRQNIAAYIVMPETAPQVKVDAVKNYGGKIFFCKPNQKAREEKLNKIVNEYGCTFIHPYDNCNIIEGQATAAKELIEEIPGLHTIISPVGGGGLLSGTLLSSKYFAQNIKVYAAEPSGADDAFRSVRDNVLYPSVNPDTICDGLLTSLSEKTFAIIKENINEIIRVEDAKILEAMYLIWTRMKIVVEPSSATVLAAILKEKNKFAGKNIGLIISGGNVDLKKFKWNL